MSQGQGWYGCKEGKKTITENHIFFKSGCFWENQIYFFSSSIISMLNWRKKCVRYLNSSISTILSNFCFIHFFLRWLLLIQNTLPQANTLNTIIREKGYHNIVWWSHKCINQNGRFTEKNSIGFFFFFILADFLRKKINLNLIFSKRSRRKI